MLEVITGGSCSGKSSYAEQRAMELGGDTNYYMATMRPWDEECAARIRRHQTMREEKHFKTLECYEDLHLQEVENGCLVLLECMSNLAANECFRTDRPVKETKEQVVERILSGILHLQKQTKTLIVVTNEVFSDGGAYEEETLSYMEILGTVNRQLAKLADRVTEVVYGIPISVKPRHKIDT